ncbi:hypothetical protein J2X69_004007 [Algoriphagus sp. 4150]|nr:hypothetical protein [Algoriphagus sp. 4150]
MINAFSKVYEKELVSDSFDILKKEKLANSSLKYLCLNATELSRGIAFRFQNFGVFGNYYYKINKRLQKKIKLADAIAASSCFPLGFEPKVFPHDFFDDHKFEAFQDYLSKINPEIGIGLMDGGIVDNQGIGSVINAIKPTSKKKTIDLLIINDVGSAIMEKWVPSEIKKTNSVFKFISSSPDFFKIIPFAFLVNLGYIPVIYLFYKHCSSQFEFGVRTFEHLFYLSLISFGVLLSLSVLSGVYLYFSVKLRKCFRNFKEKNHKAFPKSLWTLPKSLSQFPLGDLQKSTMDRVSSFSLILNEIFLRQLRRVNLQFVYKDENLKNKLITSTVYQLSSNRKNMDFDLGEEKYHLSVPKTINDVSDISSAMKTTLWWSAEDVSINRLDNLIACGQFTTCYNLIQYLNKIDVERKNSDILKLEKNLRNDWDQFKLNPLFCVKN